MNQTHHLAENFLSENGNIDTLLAFFSDVWSRMNHPWALIQIGVVLALVVSSFFSQKMIQKRCEKYMDQQENSSWMTRALFNLLSFSAPVIALVGISFAMSVTAGFTLNLEIYQFAIKLILIWFIWILITRSIADSFLRGILCSLLIPFLVISSTGLAEPVINYLDALGFVLGGVHISLFLLLKGILISSCLFWLARIVSQSVSSFIESQKKLNPEVRDLMENLFQVVLYTGVVMITLDLLGIDLKSLALVGGAVGIGIGLGLQKIAANFISGIIILFEQSIKVGHLIEVPGLGSPGWIRHLGARAVVVDAGDGRNLLIPNEELLTKTVIDYTSRDRRVRTDLNIKVAFRSDLERAKQIMLEAVSSHRYCSKFFPPACFLEKFTDNGAQFLLQFWVEDLTQGKMDMQNDVLLTIWRRFAEENIEHPAPLVMAS